jgi:RNA polymerase sigma-70 factor (TIGR02960 family)
VVTEERTVLLVRARGGDSDAFSALVAPHRRELFELCYRMLGSLSDADDVVQESLLRAWKAFASFEERASLRTWLYRITTNACLTAAERRPPRTLPSAEGPPAGPDDPFAPPILDPIWLDPLPGEPASAAPDARLDARESVAFAFLVSLGGLPPRQRAVLLLRDVLEFSAAEVADLLSDSVVSVNSALQRARETLEARGSRKPPARAGSAAEQELLAGYIRAWEAADVHEFVALLTREARLSMPPLPQWLQGREAIGRSIGAMVFTPQAEGTMRCLATTANGLPAVAVYRRDEVGGPFLPMGLHAIRTEKDGIGEIVAFLGGELFERFGLPSSL